MKAIRKYSASYEERSRKPSKKELKAQKQLSNNVKLGKGLESKGCKCRHTWLIVDDSPFNLIPLEAMIFQIEKKIRVVQATSGDEAVEIFKRDREKTCCNLWIKFVIMDIEMQIMDGVASAKAIFAICKNVQN